MAQQRKGLATDSIFRRIIDAVLGFLGLLREKETWQAIVRWGLWRIIPKRRRILKLMRELNPLLENAPPEMHSLRDEVFSKICLELKPQDQQILVDILNHVEQPIGYEQIFFTSLYPVLVKRDLEAIPIHTEEHHQLHVEIGYFGHNEDYFFCVFEIDSERRMSLKTPLTVREDQRDDKRFVIYTLGCAGLVETDFAAYAEQWLLNAPRLSIALPLLATAYAEQWILNTRIYFSHILNDLKKRNYKVTAEAIPDFERERLSILRRLSLIRLEKRQFQSSRRNR
ncbi:MAG: hypothetical protein OXD54_05660 [Candidatus Poribacteria bacterium]|nr:hypothetical protein [Candidatus Poribacteria bacterium]